MIERRFQKGDADSWAVYSDCEHYRYLLTRVWNPEGRRALFVMLNPSTATEYQNDPTVERCERRARTLGFGAFRVTNIFAYRATDPKVMRAQGDPVGRERPGRPDQVGGAEGTVERGDRPLAGVGVVGLLVVHGVLPAAVKRSTEATSGLM